MNPDHFGRRVPIDPFEFGIDVVDDPAAVCHEDDFAGGFERHAETEQRFVEESVIHATTLQPACRTVLEHGRVNRWVFVES